MAQTLIGTRIRERRRARQITQKALAASAGISPAYLNLIEHNRRSVAGRVLIALADALGTEVSQLSEEASAGVVAQLSELALTQTKAEADRTEDFAARFPGWAAVAADLATANRAQAERLTALSDRLSHDPFLAETLHQILSNITAIRSTAGILDTTPDIPPDLRARFIANLRADSQRLSETAQAVVDSFEAQSVEDTPVAAPQTQAQTFWTDQAFWVPRLEPDQPEFDPEGYEIPPRTATHAADLGPSLERYRDMARALPYVAFAEAVAALGSDPIAIAKQARVPVETVLLRLAHLPADSGLPRFGLIEVDMSGAVLLRKDIASFQLPHFASACPLWPIYRAFAAPGQPVRAVLEMPTGERLISYAIASTHSGTDYALPPLMRAVMVMSSDTRALPGARDPAPLVLAGLHCSVCPRKACPERRADYILS